MNTRLTDEALLEDLAWLAESGEGLTNAAARTGYKRSTLYRRLLRIRDGGNPAVQQLLDQLTDKDWVDLAHPSGRVTSRA